MQDAGENIQSALFERFGERIAVDAGLPGLDELARLAARCVHRRFLDRDIPQELLRLLCACALSAPSKSDLQQGDILIVRDNDRRGAIADLLPEMPWVREAPVFLVFLANGRRVPQMAELRGKPFPNDHLDLFFNATVDAAIVLATFLRAAEAVGLGCCPISVIRDHARAVSELLELPEKVVPVAGMCVGWPADEGGITPRLSLDDGASRAFRRRRSWPRRSTPMTAGARARGPTGTSAIRRASARRSSTAGRRTRRGNTRCRYAPTSAPSCARRAFISTEAIL